MKFTTWACAITPSNTVLPDLFRHKWPQKYCYIFTFLLWQVIMIMHIHVYQGKHEWVSEVLCNAWVCAPSYEVWSWNSSKDQTSVYSKEVWGLCYLLQTIQCCKAHIHLYQNIQNTTSWFSMWNTSFSFEIATETVHTHRHYYDNRDML